MQTVDIGSDVTIQDLTEQFERFHNSSTTSIEIGVRSKDTDELVGYGGPTVDRNGEADMGDFAVKPAYQGQGIGKAIIDQRIAHAERLGAHSIHISDFEPTNTLQHHYLKRGSVQHGDGTFVRSR